VALHTSWRGALRPVAGEAAFEPTAIGESASDIGLTIGRQDVVVTLIQRFGLSERIAHWLLAAAFACMLATGVFMGGIGPLHHRAVLIGHVGSAIVLMVGIAALIALRRSRRPLAQTVRDLRPLDARDRRWLLRAPRAYLFGGELPAAGRFNAGQKLNARLVLLLLVILYVSGVGELARRTSAFESLGILGAPHGLAAGVVAALVAGHVYLAMIHPATRPALRGITRGSVRRDWAEHHHAEWVVAFTMAVAVSPGLRPRSSSESVLSSETIRNGPQASSI
jgi:formate dehydrogenase subunit gamma